MEELHNMTQIKLRKDTAANFTSKNPVLGAGEPAYETDTKKLKIGDGTTAYNSLAYFTMTDEFSVYREKYGAPSDSTPVVNTGNSITIKAGVSIETPNGTLNNTTDITYTYDFATDRVLFVTENDYYHAFAVYYGGREPSPVGEQIFWFNNNVWTMIAGNGTKTVFSTQKITPIAKIYLTNSTVKNIDYSSYTKTPEEGTTFNVVQPLKLVDGTLTLQIDEQTIQVQNGKLVANLGELGDEVNTLAGDVAGIQADILNKQDKFTTSTPLSMFTGAINATVPSGITETDDSYTGGGFNNVVVLDVSGLNINADSDWTLCLSGHSGVWNTVSSNTTAIEISGEDALFFRIWFGSSDFRLGHGTDIPPSVPSKNVDFTYKISHAANGTQYTFSGVGLTSTTPLDISKMATALNQGSYTTLAGIGKITLIKFLVCPKIFERIDKVISSSYIEANGVKYPLTTVAGSNTLQLGIGSGLSVVDGNLSIENRYPVEISDKSLMPSWYVVYNDGWCEQGGRIPASAVEQIDHVVSLLKTYKDADYYVNTSKQISMDVGTNYLGALALYTRNKTASSFTTMVNPAIECYWATQGYTK